MIELGTVRYPFRGSTTDKVVHSTRKDFGGTFGKRIQCSAAQTPPPAGPGTAIVDPGRKTWDGPKPISIVRSTGSIGTQTLDIVAKNPDKFRVVALAAGSNVTLLADQPTVAAIEAGKDIALANKDTLIAGGPFVLPLAHKHKVKILPADSEHSAIFQCIQGLSEGALRRIILNTSSGAFRDLQIEESLV
ncbi:hypothetical protein AgCh_039180 [Apium graveolens]